MTVLGLTLALFVVLLAAALNEPSVLVVGSPGSGKSYAAAWDAVNFPGAVVILDPHVRSLAELTLMHFPDGEVLFDRLDDLDWSLGYALLTPPDPEEYPNPDTRAQEAKRRVQTFVEILFRRRGAVSITGSPLIEEWLMAAVALWMSGSRPWPLWMLVFAFLPGTDEFRAMVRGTTLPQIRAKFESLEGLKPRSPRSEIGAAARLVEVVFGDPSFRKRSRGGFDIGRFLQKGGKRLVEGGEDIDEDAKRVLLCGIATLVEDHARRRSVPHPPIRVSMDECANAESIGPKEQKAVAEMRKYGLSYYFISQLLNHPGGADDWLQACNRHEVFHTPHFELARTMATEMEALWRADERSRAERIADPIGKQLRRRFLPLAGVVQLRARGRPSIVVGKRCPPELLEREVWVTEAELLLGVDFDRTATIDEAVPDGAFTREGDNYAVEVDNAGKQSRKQYRQKWAKYGRFGGYILVLCHTERRMNSVLEWSQAVKSAVLATTFGRLAAGKPWTDWYGSTAEI